jgi:5'-deoxynucleotidase YfbR-like HD superfamily hydrolase
MTPHLPYSGTIEELWYLSGKVARYHTRYGIDQSVADHSWGAAMFLILHHPRPSKALLIAALTHDMPEYIAGDSPGPAKRYFPEIFKAQELAENSAARMMRLPDVELTKEEGLWLKLSDRMEAIRFVAMCVPEPFASRVDIKALEKECDEICLQLDIILELPDGRSIGIPGEIPL